MPPKTSKKFDLDDMLGLLESTKPKKVKAPKSSKKSNAKVDDILGPAPKKVKAAKAKKAPAMTYTPLPPPPVAAAGGIWALREKKGKNLGRTCLICNDVLKSRGGRPPVICEKKTCFRGYRNAYRKDYDAARAS